MATVPQNPLSAFFRGFQGAQQQALQQAQQMEENALTRQLREIQLLNAQRQAAEALKTPEQRAQEAIAAQLITQAIARGGVQAAPAGLAGESIALPRSLPVFSQELLETGAITPQQAISDAITGPVQFETPVPGTAGAFTENPILAAQAQRQALAQLEAESAARRSPLSDGLRYLTTDQGVFAVPTRGAAPTNLNPLQGPTGEPLRGTTTSRSGVLTASQQNSELSKATKAGLDPEQFRDPTTRQIDFQSLAIERGRAEGDAVTAATAIKNARLAASSSKGEKPTASKENFQLYGNRMDQADKVLSDLAEKGFDPTSIGTEGLAGQWLPNLLKSSDRQSYEQAQRNFVNAVLRKESGAVISASEFENARAQYFPQPGDSSDLLAQKAATRKLVIDEFKRLGGGSVPRGTTQITREQAQSILNEAGGDKNKAREIATQRGLSF